MDSRNSDVIFWRTPRDCQPRDRAKGAHGLKLRWPLVSPAMIGFAWGTGALMITVVLVLAVAQLTIAPVARGGFGTPTTTQHIVLMICVGMWFGVWLVCVVLQGIRLVIRQRDRIAFERLKSPGLTRKSPDSAWKTKRVAVQSDSLK